MSGPPSSLKRPALPAFSVSGRLASFRHAGRGVRTLLRTQPNLWIHFIASIAVLIAAALLHLQRWEWSALVGAIAAVWVAEAINTAIEFACHAPNGSPHTHLHVAKDVAAAAVLLAAVGAAAVGAIIMLPHLRG